MSENNVFSICLVHISIYIYYSKLDICDIQILYMVIFSQLACNFLRGIFFFFLLGSGWPVSLYFWKYLLYIFQCYVQSFMVFDIFMRSIFKQYKTFVSSHSILDLFSILSNTHFFFKPVFIFIVVTWHIFIHFCYQLSMSETHLLP